MKEKEFFIISTRYYINKKEITQKFLADSINIEAKQLSEFLNNKRNFSEERKVLIAEYFETTYLDMLNLGKELSAEKVPKLTKQALQTFDNSTIEEAPTIGREPGPEISESKKRLLDNIYKMGKEMGEEDLKDIQRNAQEKIEKKRMKEELESIKTQIMKKAS